jgi:hypothetical protein
MRKRRTIELISLSFLDVLSGALGAVIILFVAIPKNAPIADPPKDRMIEVVLKKELADSHEKIEDLNQELLAEKEKNKLLIKPKDTFVESRIDADIGFKFKGKNIVFIIDTSYSMTEEDRMTQVKAGVKMLLTSLPKQYKIDIVQFPLGERAPFRSMWGETKDFQGLNREDSFDFIYSLRPSGGTPTRETLLFVLKNYEEISDIVLLTDGAPTYHNSNRKDDIFEILQVVRESNLRKVQISAIGVGAAFLKDKTSEQYKFLSLLSNENIGFFVGF